MYNERLEHNLISSDIVGIMQDYVSIQLDLDETKVKASAITAQNIDLKRNLTKENLLRVITPETTADEELRELVIPSWCYYTYYRLLKGFQGNLTDGGYMVDGEAESRNEAKSAANEAYSIAESYIQDALDFLKAEDPNTEADGENMTPQIRVFGGEENRASN